MTVIAKSRALIGMALASGAVGRLLPVCPPPVGERGCPAAMFARCGSFDDAGREVGTCGD